MEEYFEVRFMNNEKNFINSYGVNLGHTEVPNKIVKCQLLSSRAKLLYIILCSYAGDHRFCYPSRTTLRADLGGCSDPTLTEAIKELLLHQFIFTEHRDGYTTVYLINDLDKVPLMYHSEYLHSLRLKYRDQGKLKKFLDDALDAYKKSDLIQKVFKLANPLDLKDEIDAFFENFLNGGSSKTEKGEHALGEIKPPMQSNIRIPSNVITETPDRLEKNPYSDEPPKSEKKGKDFDSLDVQHWNTYHYIRYFEHLWQEKFKLPYPTKWRTDVGAMKHVINQVGDKETVKKLIDLYFSLDDIDKSNLSIHNFSSAYIQQKLRFQLNSDSVASYKNNSSKKSSIRPDVNEEWLKRFLEDD